MITRRAFLRGLTLVAGGLSACTPHASSGSGTAAAVPGPTDTALVPTPRESAIRIGYGDELLQFGDLYVPAGVGPHPVVVVIHGGFWLNQYHHTLMTAVCAALVRDGYAALNIEYRRLGDAGGGWPGTLLDVAQAVDALRTLAPTYALDLARVGTLGHSAGGHLALWAAGRARLAVGDALYRADPLPVQVAISLAGVLDLVGAARADVGRGVVPRLLGGAPERVPERYASASPLALLPLGAGVQQRLVHGDADTLVPLSQSVAYARAAGAVGDSVVLEQVAAVGHFELIEPESVAWPAVQAAVRAL